VNTNKIDKSFKSRIAPATNRRAGKKFFTPYSFAKSYHFPLSNEWFSTLLYEANFWITNMTSKIFTLKKDTPFARQQAQQNYSEEGCYKNSIDCQIGSFHGFL
jgi:hypothetical protein